MIRVTAILCLLAISSTTFAAPVALPASLSGIDKKVMEIDNGTGCTGFFVSPDGYFVTALHCSFKFLMNRIDSKPWLHGENYNDTVRAKTWWTEGGAEPLQFDGPGKFEIQVAKKMPSTVYIGSGYIETAPDHDPASARSLTADDLKTISRYNEDFIVLKYSVDRPVPCLKVGAPIKSGESLWALGYKAGANGAPSAYQSNPGTAALRPLELFKMGLSSGVLLEDSFFDWNKLGVGTFVAAPGMSGGPIVNEAGEVVGINSMVRFGVSIFPKMTYIQESVRKYLGDEKANAIFRCQ